MQSQGEINGTNIIDNKTKNMDINKNNVGRIEYIIRSSQREQTPRTNQ